MYRDTIFQYVKKQYGTIPEYLWNDLPDSAILRNDNGKWYAVFMNLEVNAPYPVPFLSFEKLR